MTAQTELALATPGMDSNEEPPRRVLPETLEGEGIADEHVQHIRRVIALFCQRRIPFSVRDIEPALCESTQKALKVRTGTLGVEMVNAWRRGEIRKTGRRVESPWKTKHSRKVDEWEGV